jgi:DNA-binding beta-propeller fold protein YncE
MDNPPRRSWPGRGIAVTTIVLGGVNAVLGLLVAANVLVLVFVTAPWILAGPDKPGEPNPALRDLAVWVAILTAFLCYFVLFIVAAILLLSHKLTGRRLVVAASLLGIAVFAAFWATTFPAGWAVRNDIATATMGIVIATETMICALLPGTRRWCIGPPSHLPGPTLPDDQVRPMQAPAPDTRTPPRRRWWRRQAIVIPAALLTVPVIAAVIVISSQQHSPQVTLPFTGLTDPSGVAVDAGSDLYVTTYVDNYGDVAVKLAAGSSTQTVLPFTGLNDPEGVAVDASGNLYVVDRHNSRVVKLAAGSSTQAVLPFTGLNYPDGVAVDAAGNLYVTDNHNNRVVKLAAGSATQTVLPFTGLNYPTGVAVNAAGNVYVTDTSNNRVVKLAAG